jgi:hypothetical protein
VCTNQVGAEGHRAALFAYIAAALMLVAMLIMVLSLHDSTFSRTV